MYLSNPTLKRGLINAVSKKTGVSLDSVAEILQCDGPWTDHNNFVVEALNKAARDSLELGVPLSSALNITADLTDLETEIIIKNMGSPTRDNVKEAETSFDQIERVSIKTGQSHEIIDAITEAYLDCVIDFTQTFLESYLKQIGQEPKE